MLRRRNINIKNVKHLDAFPKIPNDYRRHSAVGGTFSILSVCIIIYLICAETLHFFDSRLQFKFEPDIDYNSQLQMNVDLTIAMPCNQIGADIVDSTNQNLATGVTLHEENTWWELSPDQRAHFEALKHVNSYFREEYHAIHEILWKSNQLSLSSNEMPKRTQEPSYPHNACRIYGSLNINKVAGNFHISFGRSLSFPRGHVHIAPVMSGNDYNFTHRINRFSFGQPAPGIVHPLEGDEKVTTDNMMLFQYFIEIVSTDIDMLLRKSKTYQYSVKEHARPIHHDKGSHGVPGIYFKYDTSALKIKVVQERNSISQFLVKLCASVGCIFVTNGLLNNIVQKFWYIFCCQFMNKSNEGKPEKVIVDNKEKDLAKPVNLLNIKTPVSVDNLDILSNPK